MVRARKTDLGSHLKKSYFKDFKGKDEHALQDHILKMSSHHLSVIDEIVNKSSAGKQLDSFFYPQVDISQFKGLSQKLKGHTHSAVALAKRHREIKGAGFSSFLNFGKKVGMTTGKAAWGAAKVAGKTGLKVAQKSAQWLIKNPQAAMQIGQTAVGLASNLMADDEPEFQEQAPRRKRQQTSQTSALDELLDTTDDEKYPVPEPMSKRERLRGSGMQVNISKNRWII